jgi:hypothetical protein
MSPSFKNRKIGIGKPNKKNLAPHICEFAWHIVTYHIK